MSDCGVCLTCDDSCETAFLHHKIYKAGKDHVCCECGEKIPKGTEYEYAWGKTDGYFWNCKTCLICAEIADAFYCNGRMYGGTFWEQMEECAFEEMNTACLSKLKTAAAKAYLLKRWNGWKFATNA